MRNCRVVLEEGFSETTADQLRSKGHTVKSGLDSFRHTLFGRGQIIR